MKRVGLAVLTGILCLGVTACGGSTEMYSANVRGAVAGKTATSETTAGKTDSSTESKASSKETAEGSQEIYADMDGIIFGFLSGVGAWETTLEVEPDGSFEGQLYEADMGVTGE